MSGSAPSSSHTSSLYDICDIHENDNNVHGNYNLIYDMYGIQQSSEQSSYGVSLPLLRSHTSSPSSQQIKEIQAIFPKLPVAAVKVS